MRVDAFLYLEIFVSRQPILKLCMWIICYGYTVMSRRRSAGAYLEVRSSGPFLAGLRSAAG